MSDARGENDGAAGLEPGSRVEVRSTFTGEWGRGFTVEAVDADGVRIRRVDGVILPTPFDPQDVRAERKRSMWWI